MTESAVTGTAEERSLAFPMTRGCPMHPPAEYAQLREEEPVAKVTLPTVRVPKTSSVLVIAISITGACGRAPGWFQRLDLGDARCVLFREDDRLCCCDWLTSG